MSRRISCTRDCRRAIGRLLKKDRSVADTVERQLQGLASQRTSPRDQIPGLGGLPIFKTRFRIGNRNQGRLIVLVDDERVVGIAVYAKNQSANMTADEIQQLLDEWGD